MMSDPKFPQNIHQITFPFIPMNPGFFNILNPLLRDDIEYGTKNNAELEIPILENSLSSPDNKHIIYGKLSGQSLFKGQKTLPQVVNSDYAEMQNKIDESYQWDLERNRFTYYEFKNLDAAERLALLQLVAIADSFQEISRPVNNFYMINCHGVDAPRNRFKDIYKYYNLTSFSWTPEEKKLYYAFLLVLYERNFANNVENKITLKVLEYFQKKINSYAETHSMSLDELEQYKNYARLLISLYEKYPREMYLLSLESGDETDYINLLTALSHDNSLTDEQRNIIYLKCLNDRNLTEEQRNNFLFHYLKKFNSDNERIKKNVLFHYSYLNFNFYQQWFVNYQSQGRILPVIEQLDKALLEYANYYLTWTDDQRLKKLSCIQVLLNNCNEPRFFFDIREQIGTEMLEQMQKEIANELKHITQIRPCIDISARVPRTLNNSFQFERPKISWWQKLKNFAAKHWRSILLGVGIAVSVALIGYFTLGVGVIPYLAYLTTHLGTVGALATISAASFTLVVGGDALVLDKLITLFTIDVDSQSEKIRGDNYQCVTIASLETTLQKQVVNIDEDCKRFIDYLFVHIHEPNIVTDEIFTSSKLLYQKVSQSSQLRQHLLSWLNQPTGNIVLKSVNPLSKFILRVLGFASADENDGNLDKVLPSIFNFLLSHAEIEEIANHELLAEDNWLDTYLKAKPELIVFFLRAITKDILVNKLQVSTNMYKLVLSCYEYFCEHQISSIHGHLDHDINKSLQTLLAAKNQSELKSKHADESQLKRINEHSISEEEEDEEIEPPSPEVNLSQQLSQQYSSCAFSKKVASS
ncbi:MAG: hypothetical protein KIT27_00150 [Legionellales bacterium]|nr:hypothetical protein [Legionellales bacterium]